MATPVLVPISEYLNTTYRPDRDYLEGELLERNMGERPHGLLQGILFSIFQTNRRSWNLLPILEQRVQTSAQHFRIPDICLVHPEDGSEGIVRVPPLLCVEILAKDDTLAAIQKRVDDYLDMGVTAIWMVDPLSRQAYIASRKGFERVNNLLSVDATRISIDLNVVFKELDDLLAGRL